MKLKVAFLHPDLGIGGAERLVLDVASALSNQGHEVLFLTNHFDKTHAFEELKSGLYPVQVYGDWLPRTIFGRFQAMCAYFRMIYLTLVYVIFYRNKSTKPDLYFVDLIPIAIPILKLADEKVVYYCHHPDLLASPPGGTLKKLYRQPINWVELKATKQADTILVNSEYTASVFHKTFPEIKKPIQVLYPTIAYSYLEAANTLTKKPIQELIEDIPKGSITFLSVNRFHPAKKLDLCILAMKNLKQICNPSQWSKIYLIVAGGYDPQSQVNADYFRKLTHLVENNDLESKVFLLKSPSDNLKTHLLMACDCLLYTPENEHFGIVPLEAMTVSKPVIACNSGGPRETVNHGITGYLCEPNPESLAQFMYRILDKDLAKTMGSKGKKTLEDRFSYESFSRNLAKIITKAYNKKDL